MRNENAASEMGAVICQIYRNSVIIQYLHNYDSQILSKNLPLATSTRRCAKISFADGDLLTPASFSHGAGHPGDVCLAPTETKCRPAQ